MARAWSFQYDNQFNEAREGEDECPVENMNITAVTPVPFSECLEMRRIYHELFYEFELGIWTVSNQVLGAKSAAIRAQLEGIIRRVEKEFYILVM
jgi:hypothetical protein